MVETAAHVTHKTLTGVDIAIIAVYFVVIFAIGFYFARKDDISMDDKAVTFSTKLGRTDIRAKFTMKEMLYHGKLAV